MSDVAEIDRQPIQRFRQSCQREMLGRADRTTNISPRSFTSVHFSVYFSYLKDGFGADNPSPASVVAGRTFSSMKTSLIRLFTTFAPTGAFDLDQRTTPEVVRISKQSNIF